MSSLRVALVNTNLMKPPIAPIGLDYISQSLQGEGFQVDILDLCFSSDPLQKIQAYFSEHDPVAVGISVRNTDDCYYVSGKSFLSRIKKMIEKIREETSSPLILGGCGFSVMPESILSYCDANFGMVGDCEKYFPLLVKKLVQEESVKEIPGLIYRDSLDFKRIDAAFCNLSEFPLQTRDFVDNNWYFTEGGMGGVETKRGCDRKCIYCADPIIKGRKVRLRPAKHVILELKRLLEKGINYVHFCDSEFNLPPHHAEQICQRIIEEKLNTKLHWYAYCSPHPFTDRLASLMRRAGCAGIDFGVDSGSDRILRRLGRGFTSREVKETARICRKHRIVFMYDLLLGGPGEEEKTIKETIQLMRETNPDRVGVSAGVRVYPGTPLATYILREGSFNENPHIRGSDPDDQFFTPTFFLSAKVGDDIFPLLEQLVGDDERFFFPKEAGKSKNYNYNENTVLIEAIRKGYRGAYWDILRRID